MGTKLWIEAVSSSRTTDGAARREDGVAGEVDERVRDLGRARAAGRSVLAGRGECGDVGSCGWAKYSSSMDRAERRVVFDGRGACRSCAPSRLSCAGMGFC